MLDDLGKFVDGLATINRSLAEFDGLTHSAAASSAASSRDVPAEQLAAPRTTIIESATTELDETCPDDADTQPVFSYTEV